MVRFTYTWSFNPCRHVFFIDFGLAHFLPSKFSAFFFLSLFWGRFLNYIANNLIEMSLIIGNPVLV